MKDWSLGVSDVEKCEGEQAHCVLCFAGAVASSIPPCSTTEAVVAPRLQY